MSDAKNSLGDLLSEAHANDVSLEREFERELERSLKLARAAVAAREHAYAPYSGFMVGAALLGESGEVYTGCNIENAAYTPSNCAERTAFFKAVSCGERRFAAIAVAGWPKGGEPAPVTPCGVCRQVMMEFCDPSTFRVISVSGLGGRASDLVVYTLDELLPHGFGPKNL